jgi:hypothetical protein
MQLVAISPYKTSILFLFMLLIISGTQTVSQTVLDPVGDIPAGDPDYMDMKKVKFSQYTDNWNISNISIEFWPNDTIPKGSETIFEIYMDVDNDSTTGVRLEDIGYDYKLHVDLSQWDGVSWIWGNVYWDFDTYGISHNQDAFYVNVPNLVPWRFRWEFSLVSLKWPQINWIARTFCNGHLSDQIPDLGHASLEIDTSVVADIDTVSGEYVEFIYPTSFESMDKYEVLKASELGAQIESQLCGTEFHDIQRIQFDPWFQGVAWSGNPIKMGSWMWRSDPCWFVFFHELGHNFTLAAMRFNQLYPGLGYISVGGDYWDFGTNFGEAWASMVGLYAMRELFTESRQYQLSGDCAGNLEQVFNGMKSSFIGKLHNYEGSPDFSTLYPDLLDGIFLALADSFGYDIIPRWFKILQPPNAPWSRLNTINPSTDYDSSKITAMTITACAFSVAAKVELRDLFRTRWDFPINDVLYNQIKPEIDQMINGSTLVEDSHAGPPLGFQTLGNYPNPFNGTTKICFQLPKQSSVRIRLYNAIGERVKDSLIGNLQPGNHEISYDVNQLASGVYYYVLMTEQGNLNNKLIILK